MASRREFSLSTTPVPLAASRALRNLIYGVAHVCYFSDGLQAASGLQPTPGWSGVTWDPGASIGTATGFITLSSTASLAYQIDATEWTAIWIEGGAVSGALNSDGLGSIDGATDATAGTTGTDLNVSVASGEMEFTNATVGDITVQQIIMLPWVATQDMMNQWTSDISQFWWGPAPALYCQGDILPEQTVYFYGDVKSEEPVLSDSASLSSLKISLTEIDETYLRGMLPSEEIQTGEEDLLLALNPFLYLHADDVPSGLASTAVWPNRGTDGAISMENVGADAWTADTLDGAHCLLSPSASTGEVRWSGTSSTLNPTIVFVGQVTGSDPISTSPWYGGSFSRPFWLRANVSSSTYYRLGALNMSTSPAVSTTHRRLIAAFGDGATYNTSFTIDGTRHYDVLTDTTISLGNGWRLSYPVSMKIRAIAFFDPSVPIADIEAAVEAQFG